MKRQWDIEELIEHFTLVQEDLETLANKSGPTRLGFALLLKCFQYEGRFPHGKHEIPKDVVNYVAHQQGIWQLPMAPIKTGTGSHDLRSKRVLTISVLTVKDKECLTP